jgi:Xaa-Pro dipeptidase
MGGSAAGLGLHLGAPAEYHAVDPAHPRRMAFSEIEFRERLVAVQTAIVAQGLDGLLVHTPENIYYLTGYETTGYFEYQVLVVPSVGEPALLVRNVERLNVDEYSWLPGAYVWKDGTDYFELTRALVVASVPGPRVGIEKHSWFVTASVSEALVERLDGHVLVASGRLVETNRLVKSPAELIYVRQAAGLADLAMTTAVEQARNGASELELAAVAHAAQIRAGGEYPALPHYVASGYRTELGHAHWSDRRLVTGDLLKLEFLGAKRRYHAGLTRPVFIGRVPADLRVDADICVRVQDETFAALAPGVSVDHVVRAAHAALRAAGKEAFRIRLGYSMGIGFPPIAGEGQTADFREGATLVLEAGMVFHMLSVMRVGLVISDTVLITPTGHERLTTTRRTLFEV